jgi:predicted RND superfamily exporter protein
MNHDDSQIRRAGRHNPSWFERHRGLSALSVVAVSALALFGIVRLQFDDVPRTIFRSHDEEFARLEEVFSQFGADDVDCVFLVESDDLFTPERVAVLRGLIDEVGQIGGVVRVQSLADIYTFPERHVPRIFRDFSRVVPTNPYPLLPVTGPDGAPPSLEACATARRQALAHPLAAGQLVSDDARATLVVAKLAGDDLAIKEIAPIVDQMRSIAGRYDQSGGLRIRLTGLAPIRAEIFSAVRAESSRFVLVGGSLVLIMATLLFRRPAAVAIVCFGAGVGALWAIGAMGLAGEKMNIITTVLPTLVLVIGFADAVHLMIDIRAARTAGAGPLAASRDALRHLALPCLLCALTNAVGFCSLATARIEAIQRFGVVCGIGAVLALVAVLLVVPLLSSTRLGYSVQTAPRTDVPERIARAFEPVLRKLLDYPRLTSGVAIAATLAMCGSAFLLVPSNQSTEALPGSSPALAAVEELDRSFGGSGSAQVLVEWDTPRGITDPAILSAVRAAHEAAGAHADVRNPSSLVNLVQSLPGGATSSGAGPGESGSGESGSGGAASPGNSSPAVGDLESRARWLSWVPNESLSQYVRLDLQRALIRLRLRDVGSDELNTTFADLRTRFSELEAAHPGFHYHLTGTSVVAARNLDHMISDLAPGLGSAALVVFIVMGISFRSLRLGLISIVPNLFPMALTATYLVVTGRPLQMTSVIVFSICLGIAVDDTVHFIHRFQREMKIDGDVRASIRRSYRTVGSAMIMTSLVLVAGFASLQTSDMPTTRLFSGLSCLTIGSALIGELMILPAMLLAFVPNQVVTGPHFYKFARREPVSAR